MNEPESNDGFDLKVDAVKYNKPFNVYKEDLVVEPKDGEVDVESDEYRHLCNIMFYKLERLNTLSSNQCDFVANMFADFIISDREANKNMFLDRIRILQESHDFLSQSQDIQRALCDKLEEQYLADQKEISALKEKLGRAVGYIEGRAGLDCYQYDKHLSPKLCGKCDSCEASKLLKEIESSGGAGK